MMKDRILWIIFGLIMFGIVFAISFTFQYHWKVYYKGKLCLVTITSLPNAHSLGEFMDFEKDGKIYHMRVDDQEVKNLSINQKIYIKFLNGYEDFSLFPNQNPLGSNIILIIMLLFLGIVFLFYGFKQNPPSFRLPFTANGQVIDN
jgi:hypothetical protein